MALYIVNRVRTDGVKDQFQANLHWNYKIALRTANSLYSIHDDLDIAPLFKFTGELDSANWFSMDIIFSLDQLAESLESIQSFIGINKNYLKDLESRNSKWKKDTFFSLLHPCKFEDQLNALVSYLKFKHKERHSIFKQSLAKHGLTEADYYYVGSDWHSRREKFSSYAI